MMVEIYSTPTCGQCMSAKTLLHSKDIPYIEFTVGADVDKTELEARIGAPVRSVPQIFIDDEYVGGVNELRSKLISEEHSNGQPA